MRSEKSALTLKPNNQLTLQLSWPSFSPHCKAVQSVRMYAYVYYVRQFLLISSQRVLLYLGSTKQLSKHQ